MNIMKKMHGRKEFIHVESNSVFGVIKKEKVKKAEQDTWKVLGVRKMQV